MSRVTAVMPTTESRRNMLDESLRDFERQTFADCELLILEEAREPLNRALPGRVRYEWIPPQGWATGRKRNEVNQRVQSELIIHWDSDDWYHPERITRQVARLDETGAQVTGYHDLLYFRVPDRTLWAYYFQGAKPYAVGTSLCYRRSWWQRNPFPNDRSIGEDSEFYRTAVQHGALSSLGRELGYEVIGMIVARCHPGNTYHPSFGQEPFVAATRDMFPDLFLREVGL